MNRLVLSLLFIGWGSGVGLASASDRYWLYVGLESADEVAVVDVETGKLLKTIPVGISAEDLEAPHDLAISPDGKHVFITLAHGFPNGTLWKFTALADSLEGRVDLGAFPATIAFSPDGTWAYVVNFNMHGDRPIDTISVVHTPTMTEVAQIPVCPKPHGIDVTPDGRYVLVGCTQSHELVRLDAGTFRPGGRMSLRLPDQPKETPQPQGVQVTADGKQAFVACFNAGEVRVVDLEAMKLVDRIPVGKGAYLMKMTPDRSRLYVPNKRENSVSIVDVATRKELARIPTSRPIPHTINFTPDGRWAFVSLEEVGIRPGAVDVIDNQSLKLVKTFEVGLQPGGLGVVRAGR